MLRIARDRLPPSPAARHGVLRDYFCDKDAEAVEVEDGWELRLGWPSGDERHVDPRLPEALAWWGEGVDRSGMATARRRSGRVLRTFYDTWTLYSWSEWMARAGAAADHAVVLHVDDHRDLGAPRIFVEDRRLVDAVTGELFDMHAPESVLAAVESGAVGMGSFLTPFLHAAPRAEVRHLCQPPKARSTRDHRIALAAEPDTLIRPGQPRPAVRLEEEPGATGPGCYRITPDVDAWLEGVGPGPVLLHIDMDYFNNRYDGDSDWRGREEAFDPPLEAVLEKVDDLVDALKRTGLAEQIEDMVIAYSPGFFPAELWAPADARLQQGLESLYA